MKLGLKFYIFAWALLFLTGCGGGGSAAESSDAPVVEPPLSEGGEVLSSGTYNLTGKTWTYENLRLPNKTGGYAYATYFKANGVGPHPVIVLTKPYIGINWTGKEVDSR